MRTMAMVILPTSVSAGAAAHSYLRPSFSRRPVLYGSRPSFTLNPQRVLVLSGGTSAVPKHRRLHSCRAGLLDYSAGSALSGGGAALQDAGAAVIVMAGAYALVSFFDNLTQRNLIEQSLSRKLVHILSGILFMASWPIFSTSTKARFFASLVPLANLLRLLVYGLSLATDEALIKSVTREGNPEELLRGPLYYVVVLVICALFFWRESPIGVISLAMMCGGDGVADIIGRKFGYMKLPYNRKKSWAGSLAMFIIGFLISIGMLYYFASFGYFHLDWVLTVERVALVSLVATVVESLPTTGLVDDNISVPLASMVTCFFYFPYS